MKRTTWIALGVFALLLIAFLVSENIESAPVETPVPTAQPTLRALDDLNITKIIYSDSTGASIELDKVEDLIWTSPTNPEAQVTAGNIEELLSNLNNLSVLATLPADSSLGELGLDAPLFSITFVFDDESSYLIEIGIPTAMSDGYYALINGSDIFVLPTSTIEFLPTLMLKIITSPTATPDPEATTAGTPTP